jgi:hypothetical protein
VGMVQCKDGPPANVMIAMAIAITLKRTENVDTRPPDIGKGPITAENKKAARKALKENFRAAQVRLSVFS